MGIVHFLTTQPVPLIISIIAMVISFIALLTSN